MMGAELKGKTPSKMLLIESFHCRYRGIESSRVFSHSLANTSPIDLDTQQNDSPTACNLDISLPETANAFR
jgi:hypothetical protein